MFSDAHAQQRSPLFLHNSALLIRLDSRINVLKDLETLKLKFSKKKKHLISYEPLLLNKLHFGQIKKKILTIREVS